MAQAGKSEKEKQKERNVKNLARIFESRGVTVRREKLARGPSFKVKSGNCFLSGENLIFVDKRLPIEHQTTVLMDYLIDSKIELTKQELSQLSKGKLTGVKDLFVVV